MRIDKISFLILLSFTVINARKFKEYMRCRGENCDKYELDCAKDNNDCMHTYIEYSNCVDSSTECTSL